MKIGLKNKEVIAQSMTCHLLFTLIPITYPIFSIHIYAQRQELRAKERVAKIEMRAATTANRVSHIPQPGLSVITFGTCMPFHT